MGPTASPAPETVCSAAPHGLDLVELGREDVDASATATLGKNEGVMDPELAEMFAAQDVAA